MLRVYFSVFFLSVSLLLAGCTEYEPPTPTDKDGDGYSARPYDDSEPDCDDARADVYPGAPELCDGVDNDCDELIDDADDVLDNPKTWYVDFDEDGFGDDSGTQESKILACDEPRGASDNDTDCDDGDAAINPSAEESCDGVDNNCDGQVDGADELTFSTWYADADSDGFGDEASGVEDCAQPSGHIQVGGDTFDCDDTDPAINPGEAESCDGFDNNCDGLIDEQDPSVEAETFYLDSDGDGFGDPAVTTEACDAPSGYVDLALATDCDDSDPSSYPGGSEVCDGDGADEDCDGLVNDDDPSVDPSTQTTWYTDSDADGYGDDASAALYCDPPSGAAAAGGDCDDADDSVHPGADELCADATDNDCDGTVDNDDAIDASAWYADDDGDGYGDASDSQTACDQPGGYVADGTDCDDADSAINPDTVWHYDADSDGYGDDDSAQVVCAQPAFYVLEGGDCATLDPDSHPGAAESCDEADNDCDSVIDEDSTATYYADLDGDGYGDPDNTELACEPSEDYTEDDSDCDDSDAELNPDTIWYEDLDGDGYGDTDAAEAGCEAPSTRHVRDDGDCDDFEAGSYPGAAESCDEADNDCDDDADEGVTTTWYADDDGDGEGDPDVSEDTCSAPAGYIAAGDVFDCDDGDASLNDDTEWYLDGDGDGYGDDDSPAVQCEAPSTSYVRASGDCDDLVATTWPGATEDCDGVDQDCDTDVDEGAEATFYADDDGDGFGDPDDTADACDAPSGFVSDSADCDDTSADLNPSTVWYADTDTDGYGNAATSLTQCEQPGSAYTTTAGDCDDGDGDINPDGVEVCDGEDNDCDGLTDDDDGDVIDPETWYFDADGDGYGLSDYTDVACEEPSGYADLSGDCDDGDAAYNPGADESDCSDPNDYNCDGSTAYTDGDGDGYAACEECDDTDSAVNPAAVEVCDDVDNDCDGETDEDDATDAATWYLDVDGDGFGLDAVTDVACAQPDGYADRGEDCDDGDDGVNPDANETCDGEDEDCDGEIDDAAIDVETFYRDSDGDGYGDASAQAADCEAPTGYTSDDTDCDDGDDSVNPGATEICDADDVDEDCDGSADDDDSGVSDQASWYADDDSDGYGDAATELASCDQPAGYVGDDGVTGGWDCDDGDNTLNPETVWYQDFDGDGWGSDIELIQCDEPAGYARFTGDCDDGEAAASPSETEICDEIDNDCDDEADEGVQTTWYADDDGDSYGDASAPLDACDTAPAGHVLNDDDCDDTDATYDPDTIWYLDADSDGYGGADTQVQCEQPSSSYTLTGGDCDDLSSAINADAVEVCDDADNDCDGLTDDDDGGLDTSSATTWYADADGDGYGDEAATDTALTCEQPTGYVATADDCDDADAAWNPGAPEDDCADPNDYNCDGSVTADDADGDGFFACEDCDDTDAAINDDASEICDDIDNDCDGLTDDDDDGLDTSTASNWYADGDADGYGAYDKPVKVQCDQPDPVYVLDDTDCDDGDPAIFPGSIEFCTAAGASAGDDEDCDGAVDEDGAADVITWYIDVDGDGYGAEGTSFTDVDCDQPTGYAATDDDCDDGDASFNPGADDVCDGLDNNCDGDIDDGATLATWYRDSDGDGYGDADDTTDLCSQPSGYVADATDCDDGSADHNPAATEYCDDDDDDCDGDVDEDGAADALTWYEDADGDDYGDADSTDVDCDQPSGFVSDSTDCDDADGEVNPDALEICGDSVDNDCNDLTDTGLCGTISLADAHVRLTGAASGDNLGQEAGAIGDLSGDGIADLIVAAEDAAAGGTARGTTYIFNGPFSAGDDINASAADTVITGTDDGSYSGRDVSISDLDGDGELDLFIGVARDSTYSFNAGAGYLFYGPLSGNLTLYSANAVFYGDYDEYACQQNENVGDVDGDGLDDIACGTPLRDTVGANDRGGVAVLLTGGGTDLGGGYIASVSPYRVYGENGGDYLGQKFEPGGDINGDGSADLIVTSNAYNSNDGAVYVIYGPVTAGDDLNVGSAYDARFVGGSGVGVGASVGGGRDVDGDGKDDLLLGDYTNDSSTGKAYLITSESLGSFPAASVADATFVGQTAGDRAGITVDLADDLNGDAYGDVVIAATAKDGGYIYTVYGPISGSVDLAIESHAILTGEVSGDVAGAGVTVGDTDEDGIDDLLIGAYVNDDYATDAGAAYLVLGGLQ